jgi:hypothetical protein
LPAQPARPEIGTATSRWRFCIAASAAEVRQATIYAVPLELTIIAAVVFVVGGFLSFKAYCQA